MGDLIKQAAKGCWASKWTRGLSIVAVILILIGFFIPPLGLIDTSVFIGVGEILAFGVLLNFSYALENGVKATFKHKDTEITVDDD